MAKQLKPLEYPATQQFSVSWPPWTTILASPILYGMVIPLVFFDLCLEVFHRLVFPVLGIPIVHRCQYIQIDRHRLNFLPLVLKLACAYCGYANGLLQYAVRIAGDTEAYFCPSKHHPTPDFHAPLHHQHFAELRRRWRFSATL